MKKVLLNIVHPNLETSILNSKFLKEVKEHTNITVNNLYENYSNFKIDIKKEQELLLEHDVIVFQFPLYWFSSPALLKEWFDLVFEYDFAYGSNYKLKDKSFALIISCGGTEEAYSLMSVKDFIAPFIGTANYVKMNYMEEFISYGISENLDDNSLNDLIENFKKYLIKLGSE